MGEEALTGGVLWLCAAGEAEDGRGEGGALHRPDGETPARGSLSRVQGSGFRVDRRVLTFGRSGEQGFGDEGGHGLQVAAEGAPGEGTDIPIPPYSHNCHLSLPPTTPSLTPATASCVGVQLTVQFRASDQNRDLAAGLLTSAVGQVCSFPSPASEVLTSSLTSSLTVFLLRLSSLTTACD